jgi:DNA adenine methylase
MLDRVGYPGGKSGPGVYHRLINLMPAHAVYCEPFLGAGAIMRRKLPAPYNIGVDLDAAVIERWRSLIGGNGDSAGRIGENPEPRGRVEAPIAADIGGNGHARRRPDANPPIVDPPKFRFLRGDALTFLASYPFTPDDLVYCDPPYLAGTLSSRARYRHVLTDEQHSELLSTIGELPCRVMISGYWSELYAGGLRRWNSIRYQAMTRGGMAEEWCWFNFEPPTALHDYRYLGETAHQRQDLKRMVASWTGKLEKMPPLKKQALLAAIASIGGNAARIR